MDVRRVGLPAGSRRGVPEVMEAAVRAMAYRGPHEVRVEAKDSSVIEHPGDSIVRVTQAAICGSNLHPHHGMMPDTRVGMTFGHEDIGGVDRVGPSVERLTPGDRVMGGSYGCSHTCGGHDGGQAEYVRVPFADVGPSLILDRMDDDDAVLLTDALPTGYFGWPRERSIEHALLTPVSGTACPPKMLSGVIRRYAYRYSERRAAHWLLLIGADRVDAVERHLRSFLTLHPDNPITETGLLSEFSHDGIASHVGRERADVVHQPLDLLVVGGPWVLAVGVAHRVGRALARIRRS